MVADFHPTPPKNPEALSVSAAQLDGLVDVDAYREGLDGLLEAVGALTARGTPEGQAWVRRFARQDAHQHPDQLPNIIEAVQAASERQAESETLRSELFDRAAWVDPFRHGLIHFGFLPQPTVEQSANWIIADAERRKKGLPPNTMLRKFGRGVVNFAQERGLL